MHDWTSLAHVEAIANTILHFWARGYCVSTVGWDEETIRRYIEDQDKTEKQ